MTATPLRIGSLCSGYGGLDMAVIDALGGNAEVAWHAQYEPPKKDGRPDLNQWAARILAHHWPDTPNHGDITRADWFTAEPVDILTAGFPCQPISLAGRQLGTQDARWIWPAVAQAVRLLRPRHVFLENVAALTIRGLPAVTADLARIGYVGSWICLRASDIGAPHGRNRVFILAEPAENAHRPTRDQRRVTASRQTQGRRTRPDAGRRGGAPASDTGRHPRTQDDMDRAAAPGSRRAAVPDTEGDGRHQGWPEPARILRRPDAAVGGSHADFDFGPYAAAVTRWERILGRPAPDPVTPGGRLAPVFAEWMMGLPKGWVTDVPGNPTPSAPDTINPIPRSAQLHELGNGVVPQQGAAAFRILTERMGNP